MNLYDLKTLLQFNLLNCIEASPMLLGEEKRRIYDVRLFIKTPTKTLQAAFDFHTDRPFTNQPEIIEFFTAAGVTKDKILFVFPRDGMTFHTAELLS